MTKRKDIDALYGAVQRLNSRIETLEEIIHTQDETIHTFKVGDRVIVDGPLCDNSHGIVTAVDDKFVTVMLGVGSYARIAREFIRPADAPAFKVGDKVQNRSGTHRGTLVKINSEWKSPYVVRDDATGEHDDFTTDELRPADTPTQEALDKAEARADKAEAHVTELESQLETTVGQLREYEARANDAEKNFSRLAREYSETVQRWKQISDDKQAALVKTRARADRNSQLARGLARRVDSYRKHSRFIDRTYEMLRNAKADNDQYAKEIELDLRHKLDEARADRNSQLDWKGSSEYWETLYWHAVKECDDNAELNRIALEGANDRAHGIHELLLDAKQERDEARETAHDLAVELEKRRRFGVYEGLKARADAAEKNAKNATENLAIADQELDEYRAIRDRLVAKLKEVREVLNSWKLGGPFNSFDSMDHIGRILDGDQ